MNSARLRSIFVYILIVVAIVVLLFQFRSVTNTTQHLTMSDLAASIQRGEVKQIVIDDNTLHVTFKDGRDADTRKDPTTTGPQQLAALGVSPEQMDRIAWDVKKPLDLSGILTFLGNMLPALVVVGMIYFIVRKLRQWPA